MIRRLALTTLATVSLLTQVLAETAPIPICGAGKRITCVVDGDTFWLNREKIRILNIDAPEVQHYECPYELQLGRAAAVRLKELLSVAPIVLARGGTDRYGRTLATISVNGQDVGAELVTEHLAKLWEGHKAAWCGDPQ